MNIYSTIQIGDFHNNNCEDFYIIDQLSSNRKLIAVMDGCTMGNESQFASILIGKILRKISKEKYYSDFLKKDKTTLKDLLKEVIKKLFIELKSIKNNLDLEVNELLSTIIIGSIDTDNYNGEFLTIGDGLIFYDENIIEYEQEDKPDYLGYHLSEDFEEWYSKQNQRLSVNNFSNLSIATDGIFSFKNFKNPEEQKSELEIINFLLKDKTHSDLETFLDLKIKELKERMDHIVTDDISIIRITK